MGTSTVHRSPLTGRWRIVNSIYDDAVIDRSRLLSEVFNAATAYVEGLSDAAVMARVETLLRVSAAPRVASDDPIEVATEVVRQAQEAGRAQGVVSFYGDLADRALFATFARGAEDPSLLATQTAALSTFTRELLGFAVDHLVSRDLGAHIGGGSLRTAASAIGLRGDLIRAAQEIADTRSLSSQTRAAAESPRDAWPKVMASAWRAGAALSEFE